MPNAEEPDLRTGVMNKQAFGRCIVIPVDLIYARLYVDGHELALVIRLEVGAAVTLINGLTAPCKLLFARVRF